MPTVIRCAGLFMLLLLLLLLAPAVAWGQSSGAMSSNAQSGQSSASVAQSEASSMSSQASPAQSGASSEATSIEITSGGFLVTGIALLVVLVTATVVGLGIVMTVTLRSEPKQQQRMALYVRRNHRALAQVTSTGGGDEVLDLVELLRLDRGARAELGYALRAAGTRLREALQEPVNVEQFMEGLLWGLVQRPVLREALMAQGRLSIGWRFDLRRLWSR